jgi:hypothetical protein
MAHGDRLRVKRRLAGPVCYRHHGIDVGDGTVIHARPDDPARLFGGGRVVRTSLEEFANGESIDVVSDPPALFPPAEIVDRAMRHLNREGYCPVVDNCEHFATWCATGRRSSRQVDIVIGRVAAGVSRVAAAVSARAAVGAAERVAVRTVLGTSVRIGLKTMLPAAIVGEAAALAAEWTAHQRGKTEQESRRAGEAAGLAATSLAFAAAGAPAGPAGALAGALAGAPMWLAGSATAAAATGAARQVAKRITRA